MNCASSSIRKLMNNSTLTYFNYLEIIRKSYPTGLILSVDPISCLILDEIALHEKNENPLTITSMMAFLHIASQATIHRKLKQLISDGYVKSECVGANRRTKHLTVTRLALRYYKTLSQIMNKACSSK